MTQMQKLLRASAGLAALCLAACAAPVNGPEATFDINQRFPIAVEPRMMTLHVAYSANGELDRNTDAQIERFAHDYVENGSGAIAVSAPSRYPDAPSQIAERLIQFGVPSDRILVGSQDDPAAPDSVKLTYIRYQAQAPACANWSQSLTATSDNRTSPNFGCATQHNVAAEVADPRDLVSPRPLEPTDAQRRLEVLDKYRRGETTVSDKTQQQSGAVSTIAQ